MIIEGKALVIEQANVDTDVLYPGSFLNLVDPEQMKLHLFEGLDPTLRCFLTGPTVLVVGANFGTGSSREQAPLAMKTAGINCVIGESFARIFFRNCINLGLPAFSVPDAVHAIHTGTHLRIDTSEGTLMSEDGMRLAVPPLPVFMTELLAVGGLETWIRQSLRRK